MTAISSGEVVDNAQIMRDEHERQLHLLLQILQKVQNLGLNGDVQCRDRLVADDELRVHGKRAGDADTLAAAAVELVRDRC